MKHRWFRQVVSPLLLSTLGVVSWNLRASSILRAASSTSPCSSESFDGLVGDPSWGPPVLPDRTPVQHSLDNQTYIWYGNQWVPPPGVPLYTREAMKAAFSQFDTLWIGDSTIRRAYATIYALMNATDASVSVQELDDKRVIDVNKLHILGTIDEDSCKDRRDAARISSEPDWPKMWTNASVCRQLGQRSFDYIRTECLRELADIAQLTEEIKRYSLVVVGMGVHDAMNPYRCAVPGQTTNSTGEGQQPRKIILPLSKTMDESISIAWEAAVQIEKTMEEEQAKSHAMPTTAVVWRTSGFYAGGGQAITDRVHYFNQWSLDKFHNRSNVEFTHGGRMALVDWGNAIFPRSFAPTKIEGDIPAHYGLEARMLMAQMTTQQVMNILDHTKVLRASS